MPGIVVGIDGSRSGQPALEWAVRHAAAEHLPVTVLTVHPVLMSAWTGGPVITEVDEPEQEKAC